MIYERLLRPLSLRSTPKPHITSHSRSCAPPDRCFQNRLARLSPVSAFGLNFRHRVGLAAGLDKNGVALPALGSARIFVC